MAEADTVCGPVRNFKITYMNFDITYYAHTLFNENDDKPLQNMK